ncbi:hypothetical protein HBH64_167630 [Parastagonospora nodorum]|nr:hypothetical protein HBI09_156900 [Parastagonospora nodorum]KAH4118047.1 hypothetical protein HBH47_145370 [Parastagonospora nodorum]KAH4294040.1 hypothetical protein HBI01_169420 [Parastagonospora nodorum]KAH4296728.1 hypothetical protein HBI02_168250 [Parastagonospora nodorum]KAH4325052.1 hypothetical protein HBI00_160040 [Parastagonospora nodorum]
MACRAHSSFEYYGQQMEAGEIAAVGRLERHRLSNRTVMARQTADGRRQTADGRRQTAQLARSVEADKDRWRGELDYGTACRRNRQTRACLEKVK